MKVIQKNYSAVSFSRSLQNDYLMKTTVHSDSDNYVRVTINDNNYESKNSTDIANRWYDTIEKKKNSEQKDSIPFLLRTKKLVLPKHSKIIGLSVNDSYSRQKNYVCGKIEGNILTLDSGKPYNNEGFCYEGIIELDDNFLQKMTKEMSDWPTLECFFCGVLLRESPEIIINILVQRLVNRYDAKEKKTVVLSDNGWHKKIFLYGSALMLCIIATVYLYKSSHV